MQESQNVEWKEVWKDEYLKWICGFANANGGKIFVGKNDNGEIVGLKNSKRLLEDIPNKIQNHLGIICDVILHEISDKQYIEIDVKPYEVPISYQGKYHYRSGSTKQELKGNALNNFLLKKVGKTWDDVIEPRVEIEDIDLKAIETFKESAFKSKRMPFIKDEKNIEVILDNLLLLENNKLKRAGVLLFGKKPNRFYINAFVKIGRFGKTSDDLLFQEIVEGNIFELADKTLDILDKKFLIAKISYEGLHRVEQWEYPYEAVRETIINAIVHRDYMGAPIQISVYDDKIIVWNEGSLPNDLTIDDLKEQHSSRPHNPILASSFFKGGLIEAWGRGTVKIINECKNTGLPEPKIENVFGGIQVTLFKNLLNKTKLIELGLNDRQIKAIEYLKENGKITNSIYRHLVDVTEKTAFRDLDKLVDIKILIKRGDKKGAYYILVIR
jgi:ATP-dependent DNA helicase RecG